jgi:hypothetical protein
VDQRKALFSSILAHVIVMQEKCYSLFYPCHVLKRALKTKLKIDYTYVVQLLEPHLKRFTKKEKKTAP